MWRQCSICFQNYIAEWRTALGLLAPARQEEEEMIFLSSLQKIRRETQTVNVELFNTRNQNFSEKTLHWFHSVAVITSALHAEGTTYSMVPQVAACVGCKKKLSSVKA